VQGDDFGDILKGGLQSYLDIVAYRELSDIDNKPLRQDAQTVVLNPNNGRPTATGTMSVPAIAGINAAWWLGGGLVVVALLALFLKR